MGVENGEVVQGTKLTDEELEAVHKLRERLTDISYDRKNEDTFLIKWLIARSFNFEKAEDMFRKHVQFLEAYGAFDLDKNSFQNKAVNYFYTAFLGYDKEGSIIRLLNIGATDLRAVTLATTKSESIRHAIYILKSDEERQKKERGNDMICDMHTIIVDLKGLSWKSVIHTAVVQRSVALLKAYEANYPERVKVIYVVNAPSFFNVIYNWLKSFLPEVVISKLEILPPEEFHRIRKYVDDSILPAYLGGQRTDPDGNPECSSLYAVPLGSQLPESLWACNQHAILIKDPEAKRTVVENKGTYRVETVISTEECSLLWDFQTDQYDIRMGLDYKANEDSEPQTLIKLHRVDSHRIPESGRYKCFKTGIYEIIFDNTYSWMNKKDLIYKIQVLQPGEELNC